jgi:replicative DNA helicase
MKELYNIELEEAVLGFILTDSALAVNQIQFLKEDVFYKNENKLVFKAIQTLLASKGSIDIFIVINELKRLGVAELEHSSVAYYLSKLSNKPASVSNIETYSAIIYQKYLERELKKLALGIENKVNEVASDCFEVIGFIEKELKDLTSIASTNIKTIKEIHTELVNEQKEVLAGNVKTGIMSGLKNLDSVTGGWQNGNLVIVGARPAMGKSAFALQLAKYPAMTQKIPVAIFSLEMTPNELVGRMVSSHTGINNTKINQKGLNAGELLYVENNCDELTNSPIYFDGSSNLSSLQFKSKARKLYYEKGVRLFIVDYLQFMTGSGNNKEQQVSEISRSLKSTAKELNCPVIALCQLSRAVELRPDKRPILSDLRDSGSIEQDADIVMFLYRPAYYEILEPYQYGNYSLDPTDLLSIDIAKGRGLKIGDVPAKFFGETMIVTNYDL